MKTIYLDNASTTKIYPEVINIMKNTMKKYYGNPSSIHSIGRNTKSLIENARNNIAKLIHASPEEIVFTSSATESSNLILYSCIEKLNVKRIITTVLEHKCILETIFNLKKKYIDLEICFLPINSYGIYLLDDLEKILDNNSKITLVTLMHANNEIGNLINLCKVGEICKQYNVFFQSDTVQTIGKIPINLKKTSIDFIFASAHKFHGPKGVGFTYVKNPIEINPIIFGGGQENNIRSGTENFYGIIGMNKALEISLKNYKYNKFKIEKIKSYTIKKFYKIFPKVKFVGKSSDLSQSIYTILNVLLPFKDPLIAFKLDLKGIAVSQSSACNSRYKKNNLLNNLLDKVLFNSYTPIRISFSSENTTQEIDYLIKCIKEIYLK